MSHRRRKKKKRRGLLGRIKQIGRRVLPFVPIIGGPASTLLEAGLRGRRAIGGLKGLKGKGRRALRGFGNFSPEDQARAALGIIGGPLGVIGQGLLSRFSPQGGPTLGSPPPVQSLSTDEAQAVSQFVGVNGQLGPVEVEPIQRITLKAPAGYVLVTRTNPVTRQKNTVAMLRPVAQKLGLWRPKRKPLLSVTQTVALRKSASAQRKLKRETAKFFKVTNK